MKLEYASEKVRLQCTSVKAANKLFGGKASMTTSLLARMNALESAEHLKDIVVQPAFRFHSLKNKKRTESRRFLCNRCKNDSRAMENYSTAIR